MLQPSRVWVVTRQVVNMGASRCTRKKKSFHVSGNVYLLILNSMKDTTTSPELNILNTFLLLKYCRLYTEWTAGNEYMQRDGFLHFTVQNYELFFTLILIIFLVLSNVLIYNVNKYLQLSLNGVTMYSK